MPIQPIKINLPKLEANKTDVPADLKISRGRIFVFKGKFAFVTIDYSRARRKSPLCLRRKNFSGGNAFEFFPLADLEKVNSLAAAHEANGARFGEEAATNSREESQACSLWREFFMKQKAQGITPRSFVSIVKEALERESDLGQTDFFSDAAYSWLEYKERRADWSENMRERRGKMVSTLTSSPALKDKRLSEITALDIGKAIEQSISTHNRKTERIAPATLSHWQKLVKQIFAWWYDRANADRPQSLQLKNPLARMEVVSVQYMDEPEIITVSSARALLVDLLEHTPAAVPGVAVQLFCGVRNAEAARLKWKDIRGSEADGYFLYLSKAITKTTQARSVPVSENLTAWLAAARIRGVTASPDDFLIPVTGKRGKTVAPPHLLERRRLAFLQHAIEAAVKRTGASKPSNSFRHTAISAMCILHNEFLAAQWAGHDRKIQGEFYKAAMSKQDAKDYFGIMPPQSGKPAIIFERSLKEDENPQPDENKQPLQRESATA